MAVPADPDRIWAWSYGRLWATEDGGRTWAQDAQFGEFGAMALAPGEPEQGLAAGTTGAGDGRVQVRRTQDGGRTWSAAGTVTAAEAPWRLGISPADPRRALMAFNGGGLWVTVDAGATWREVTPAGHVTGAGLAWDHRRRDTLYAWFMRLAPDLVGPWELYRSDDAGATWQRLTPPPGGGLGNVWAVPDGDGVRLYADVGGEADMALASSLDGGRRTCWRCPTAACWPVG